jgi:hypothetical protein
MQSGRVNFMQIPYNAADAAVVGEVLLPAEKLDLGVIAVSPPEHKPT